MRLYVAKGKEPKEKDRTRVIQENAQMVKKKIGYLS